LADNVNIWLEAAELTAKYKCISFAQGSPEFQPPAFLKQNIIEAIEEGQNQYCRSFGHPLLINKVAEVYGEKLKRQINPMTEVLISHGATGALSAFLNAFVNRDE
jgi:aspartate/methionine/tyrosine aminotransferase